METRRLGWAAVALFFFVNFCASAGCIKLLSTPPEERVYFPEELSCVAAVIISEESKEDGFTCKLPPGGKLEDFLIVGQKAWLDKIDLIDDCIDAGLLKAP